MGRLQLFLLGPQDTWTDMDVVRNEVGRINGCSSHLTNVTIDVDYWQLKESGIYAQKRIYRELEQADLAVFLFHKRCGETTRREFDAALSKFQETGSPEIKVWLKYVPDEYAKDPGSEYLELIQFKNSLRTIPPDGLIYSVYKSDAPTAIPFKSNDAHPLLETLCWQELVPFLLRKRGLFKAVLADTARIPDRKSITRDMIRLHWKERASRIGLGPVISTRYGTDKLILENTSDQLVAFVLDKTRQYVINKRVIELGSGIGRFTLPLLDNARSLTTVDMSPDMTEIPKKRLGPRWNELTHLQLFVEDLPVFDNPFDCAFSCLLFVHVVTQENLRQSTQRIKQTAQTVILCEHTDLTAERNSSNFTRIWPRATCERLFSPEFREIASHGHNYFGDKLDLLVFQRIEPVTIPVHPERFIDRTTRVLIGALPRDSSYPPKLWQEWYTPFNSAGLWLSYESLLGSEDPPGWEFNRDKISICIHQDDEYKLPMEVRCREDRLTKIVVEEIENRGDFKPVNESKARVQQIIPRDIDPIDSVPRMLEIHLRPMTYYHYLVMKKVINDPTDSSREKYSAHRLLSLETIGDLVTTNIGGCGIFCLTLDGYIILSLRKMVAEHPAVVSYSASGSMNWWYPGCKDTREANPFLTVMREGHEELGMPIDIERVMLFAIGVDLTGMFVQFSFYVNVGLEAEEILHHWKNATSKFEQIPIAVPFLPEEVSRLVVNYAMEPSAAATLIQLSERRFGRSVMEACIKQAIMS